MLTPMCLRRRASVRQEREEAITRSLVLGGVAIYRQVYISYEHQRKWSGSSVERKLTESQIAPRWPGSRTNTNSRHSAFGKGVLCRQRSQLPTYRSTRELRRWIKCREWMPARCLDGWLNYGVVIHHTLRMRHY